MRLFLKKNHDLKHLIYENFPADAGGLESKIGKFCAPDSAVGLKGSKPALKKKIIRRRYLSKMGALWIL